LGLVTLVIGVLDTADWGGARPEDIREVCLSAAGCFAPAIAERFVEPIRVQPSSDILPRARFKRLDTGQIAIDVAGIQGRLWARLSYQFGHEFLHVLANFRPPVAKPTAWIEESLCETASLFALRAMAIRWRTAPPYRGLEDNADHLAGYANERIERARLPAGATFAEWLGGKLPLLTEEYERREDNTVIASHLLPLFEQAPEMWRAVRYLNQWSTLEDVSFDTYFSTWRSVTPVQHHPAVDRIEQRLIGSRESPRGGA
jgi:hypothetical protein